ncbi:hypothetical protein BB419_04260 [Helicobacter pylori]|uniref:DUF3972 domain-containing protein n=1 Tax=Helicobacter pylori TaxID=210 RepID=UPI000992B8FF|nr:DUF3972 domain-containing protein [Helicobacter pylori]OOP88533.1 hypothetical protein B0X38_08365 [Helicobacter pylori]PDW21119.1 hypothetical protein BB477_01460 [Helicobacter pylori]PDW70193.1 hypothetical protein BB418_03270 [Helicobacter pylori]PDW71695.1 hypothetical protein BB419_04260 [Helicobacter pylori]
MDILDLNKVQATQQNEQEVEDKELESKEPVVLEDLSALAWLELEEFSRLSGLPKERILELVNLGKIKSKISHNKLLIDASSGTNALIKKVENNLISMDMNGRSLEPVFVEKTINTILNLHDKVIGAKDETISAFKNENIFLKDALISMQEVYEEDKKTIDLLRDELNQAREEIEFMKRKYRLMWGKVADMSSVNKK